MEQLLKDIDKLDYEELYKIEQDIYVSLYHKSTEYNLPCVNAFLIVSSWVGTSQRSGVWTFYETTEVEKIHYALQYLKKTGADEIAEFLEKGIHDYQNPIYAQNFDYPDSWMEESEEIDRWITEHEELLLQWKYNLLVENKELLTSL